MLPSTDRSTKLWDSNKGNAVPCIKQRGFCCKVLSLVTNNAGTVTKCPTDTAPVL